MLLNAILGGEEPNPDYRDIDSLTAEPDLTQVGSQQRLADGTVPAEQALGFRVEQGQTSNPLAEALLRPRVEPDPSMLPAIPNIDGTMPVASSAAPQYGDAPPMPPEVAAAPPRTTDQIQQDLRVISEVDTAALPKTYRDAEGTVVDMSDPNIHRPTIPSEDTAKERFLEAYQAAGPDVDFSNMGELEKVLFSQIMADDEKIWEDLPPSYAESIGQPNAHYQLNRRTGEVKEVSGAIVPDKPDEPKMHFATIIKPDGSKVEGLFTATELRTEQAAGSDVNKSQTPMVEINQPGKESVWVTESVRNQITNLNEEYKRIVEAAEGARSTLNWSLNLPELTKKQSGMLAGIKNEIGRFAQAVGFTLSPEQLNSISTVEGYNAGITNLLKDLLATQKGPQTDADAARLAAALPTIKSTPEGRQYILNMLNGVSARAIQKKAFFDKYYEEHPLQGTAEDGKRGYDGAQQAWEEYTKFNPLMIQGADKVPFMYADFKQQIMRDGGGTDSETGQPLIPFYDIHGNLQLPDKVEASSNQPSLEKMRTLGIQYKGRPYTPDEYADHLWREIVASMKGRSV